MEYHEAANFLFDLRRFRPKPGTASTADLLEGLGDPHADLDVVQIAGSNGKGSTARMTESILRAAGLDVGLYTSPHFDDVRERIRVNGRIITKAAICEFVEAIRPRVNARAARNDAPTFFEVLTAMALWEFGRRDVDVAVLEVGIGGPYDATSAVEPIASAVTSVALEHTDLLGDTVVEIARDKVQIAPRDRPLVTGANGDALSAIRGETDELVVVGDLADGESFDDRGVDVDIGVRYHGRTNHDRAAIDVAGPDWSIETTIPLLGRFQARNAGIAAVLARQVADVDEGTVAAGLRRAEWPGRAEVVQRTPVVILDGAHNPAACAEVATVVGEFDVDSLTLVIGAMHDKDHAGMAAALPEPDRVITCRPANDRAEDADVLATVYADAGIDDVSVGRSVADALDRALAEAGPDDGVLVTGSLFTVAEARGRWSRVRVPKPIDSLERARAVLAGADVPADAIDLSDRRTVHRAVRTRVSPRQARVIAESMCGLGGTCAMSGLAAQDEEPFEVVLAGTIATFDRLIEDLHERSDGVSDVAEGIRRRLDRWDRPSGDRGHPWERGPCVMGVLNVTPDSFHDGGRYEALDDAVDRAATMIDDGAAIVDVGGESTRPGADPVPAETEIERVVPVVERLAALVDGRTRAVEISVDTRKPTVARAAIEAGATMLNDVTGLEDPAMRSIAAEYDVPVVVMHSIDAPVIPGKAVEYDDVVDDVIAELRERVLLAERAGLDRSQIVVDPGLGFGKTAGENFELIGRIDEFRALGCPVMIGHSHKSMFEHIDRSPGDRLAATIAGTALAVERGVDIVRVHDVAENVDALRAAVSARAVRRR